MTLREQVARAISPAAWDDRCWAGRNGLHSKQQLAAQRIALGRADAAIAVCIESAARVAEECERQQDNDYGAASTGGAAAAGTAIRALSQERPS